MVWELCMLELLVILASNYISHDMSQILPTCLVVPWEISFKETIPWQICLSLCIQLYQYIGRSSLKSFKDFAIGCWLVIFPWSTWHKLICTVGYLNSPYTSLSLGVLCIFNCIGLSMDMFNLQKIRLNLNFEYWPMKMIHKINSVKWVISRA